MVNEVRAKAWETRREKYGPRGHNSSYVRSGCSRCMKMEDLLIRLHVTGELSEGQVAKATDLHRIEIRRRADDIMNAALSREASHGSA